MDFPNLSALENKEQSISFHVEEIDFVFEEIDKTIQWLNRIAGHESKEIVSLDYVFCSDEYLHKINVEYLNHDTYTDIITFDLGEPDDDSIAGEIYISVDRVKENAQIHECLFKDELLRVVAHGLLHLIGYPDKSKEESLLMRSKEEDALRTYKEL